MIVLKKFPVVIGVMGLVSASRAGLPRLRSSHSGALTAIRLLPKPMPLIRPRQPAAELPKRWG